MESAAAKSRVENTRPAAASDHPAAETVNPTAEPDHPVAAPDHPAAASDHPASETVNSVAEPDRPIAEPDHPIAEPDHPVAEPDHPIAEPDHPVAESDHPTAAPDRPVAESERPPTYRERVPAVARAIQALEALASAQQPLSLTALSRATGVGPSSLLAILTTLRADGLVTRSPRDGRYVPGPGLVALGAAAAQRLEPLHAFDRLASELVERFGETVLLWIQQGDGLVMAAVREGTHPLRYVPSLGLRLPATGWVASVRDGLIEGSLEPTVWLLAAPLDEHALLALVGPDTRLRGAAGEHARHTLIDVVAAETQGGAWVGAGPIEPGELDAFLSQALVASLSYLSADGYPASVPLWYDWDGRAFWLVPSPAAEWAGHVQRNPRVSLSISESTPPLRRVLARGPLVAVEDPDASQWRTVEGRLAARYARLDPARLLEGRVGQSRSLLRLVPEQLIAWRGLLRPAQPGSLQPGSIHAGSHQPGFLQGAAHIGAGDPGQSLEHSGNLQTRADDATADGPRA